MIDLQFQDGEETRSWEILKDIDRRHAVELYPDFDVAYLRAAYITPSIDDHAMADVSFLEQGLGPSIRKSEILARLAAWHTWNTHSNEFAYGSSAQAVALAVQALVAVRELPPKSMGSMYQAYQLVVELMRYFDKRLSDDLYWKATRLKLGDRQQREIRYTAEGCVRSFPQRAKECHEIVVSHLKPRL
jgi:hypothetical protein